MKMTNIEIVEYEWAGKWGPFKIKSYCKECDITWSMLKDMKKKAFKGKPVKITSKPWLDNWLYCLVRGSFHAPIIMVNGKKFHQFSHNTPIFNRKKLTDHVFHLLEEKR